MFSLVIRNEPDRDILIAELWEAGATGITEETNAVIAFFEGDAELVLRRFSHLQTTVEEVDTRDWVRFSQDQWQPFPLGERFYLVPDWLDHPAPEGRLRLSMRPGMACGTGTHPATRLCLLAMERYIRPADSLLDVGTGAGILADAANLLGASKVFACDIEHESTRVAQANLPRSASLFTGSARSVTTQAVDWAVCNLNATTLKSMSGELTRIARGLILSGFRSSEAAEVSSKFRREIREEIDLECYSCLIL